MMEFSGNGEVINDFVSLFDKRFIDFKRVGGVDLGHFEIMLCLDGHSMSARDVPASAEPTYLGCCRRLRYRPGTGQASLSQEVSMPKLYFRPSNHRRKTGFPSAQSPCKRHVAYLALDETVQHLLHHLDLSQQTLLHRKMS